MRYVDSLKSYIYQVNEEKAKTSQSLSRRSMKGLEVADIRSGRMSRVQQLKRDYLTANIKGDKDEMDRLLTLIKDAGGARI